MLDWIVWNPIPAGIIGLCIAAIYFAIIYYIETTVFTMIRIGDKVTHDYSLHQGVVLSKRKAKNGYNYQVRFHIPENVGSEEYRIDWYKRDVLRGGK